MIATVVGLCLLAVRAAAAGCLSARPTANPAKALVAGWSRPTGRRRQAAGLHGAAGLLADQVNYSEGTRCAAVVARRHTMPDGPRCEVRTTL
jgi:hypothetical protein